MDQPTIPSNIKIVENGRLCCDYLTGEIPGFAGSIKKYADDFQVTEIPSYSPSGNGTHTYFGLWKKNIDTNSALRLIARAIGKKVSDFGTAGLKDATAITQQSASIEHLSAGQLSQLENFDNGQVKVTWISRHTNKLKPGHLIGNRFQVRIRDIKPGDLQIVESKLKILQSRGVPNFYGPQRFGNRGNNWKLGLALLKSDFKTFVDLLVGEISDNEKEKIQLARSLYNQGQFEQSLKTFDKNCKDEKAVLAALIKNNFNYKRAVSAADKFLKRFCINALQSAVFNMILNGRLREIDKLTVGDLAVKTSGSACFTIEQELISRELERAANFEISATAPMPGSKIVLADGEAGNHEHNILEYFGLTLGDFSSSAARAKGTRRAMRYPIADTQVRESSDENGSFIELRFSAPAGCYATSLTREFLNV